MNTLNSSMLGVIYRLFFALISLSSLCLSYAQTSKPKLNYDPNAQVAIDIKEVEYLKTESGRSLKARIYQPRGFGPFPTLIDFHGGAWNNKDRFAEEPMDTAIAKSGVLVIAVDLTLAGDRPYPANVQDAHYAVRWVKHNAKQWQGDVTTIGVYGSSSGGHVGELLSLKPNETLFAKIPFVPNPQLDASFSYLATRSPISNPPARYENAIKHKRENMIKNNLNYFKPWETIYESSPQAILDKKMGPKKLIPLLIMQGELDDNVLPETQKLFAQSYQTAGGDCTFLIFEQSEHEWVAKESPQTDLARKTVKNFIAKQLL
jgi:acetyl esterase/lipase